MLTLENVSLTQGDFTLRADFSVPAGTKVAVIGPSGAGKSTLLSVIAGFLQPDAGRVLWQQRDLTRLAPGVRPVSIVFQDNNLFPHLTAAQNVGLGLRPDLKLDSAQHEAVQHSLERVGLAGFGARKPGTLSGGQQGRVALARVLVQARPLVLLDEPFGALGPALKAEMLTLLESVLEETGATMLMVSHDPQDARRVARQVILVESGTAHAPQETQALFADPPRALRDYLG